MRARVSFDLIQSSSEASQAQIRSNFFRSNVFVKIVFRRRSKIVFRSSAILVAVVVLISSTDELDCFVYVVWLLINFQNNKKVTIYFNNKKTVVTHSSPSCDRSRTI